MPPVLNAQRLTTSRCRPAFRGVTMSIHKLTAGSGYDYLTRQVAAQDVTEKGHTGLAGYYAATGEAPGRWVGSGMAGIDGLAAGDVVTAEQMRALFGSGRHPLARQRREQLQGPDLTDRDYQGVTRLGLPYKVYARDVSAFRLEVAQRIAELNVSRGAVGSAAREVAVSVEDRARIRTQVAVEFFRAEHGRDPADAREIAATIAKNSYPRTTAVAGYDLTFSPVKSVSTLWAVADPATSAQIERAHQAAVKDALRFLEEHALYTRTGTNGVRQVNVQGLVATAFTHRDSRAGDPDLHTHVAVANKVQTGDGRWLSIDGRVLFKANVSASETYNTALEKHLTCDLGLRFEQRPDFDVRKRPVREVVGVDPRLNEELSMTSATADSTVYPIDRIDSSSAGSGATTIVFNRPRPPSAWALTPLLSVVQLANASLQASLEISDVDWIQAAWNSTQIGLPWLHR